MVSNIMLTILVPLLFLILFQMAKIARETSVDTELESKEHHQIGESDTVSYSEFTEQSNAFQMADILPTLGRWSQGMGVFGILHFLITSYLFVTVTALTYVAFTDNILAIIGAVGLAIVWLILPFLVVPSYDELTDRNIRPKSIDFHVTAVFFELLLVFGVAYVSALIVAGFELSFSFLPFLIPDILIDLLGVFVLVYTGRKILGYHNLFYNPYFILMLSEEMKFLANKE